MSHQSSVDNPELGTAPASLRLELLKISGADPAVAQGLQKMMWHVYRDHNCPHGVSEEAMYSWWHEQLEVMDS